MGLFSSDDVVIKEYGPGNVYLGSKTYGATPSELARAYSELERIEDAGHRADCNRYDDVKSGRW